MSFRKIYKTLNWVVGTALGLWAGAIFIIFVFVSDTITYDRSSIQNVNPDGQSEYFSILQSSDASLRSSLVSDLDLKLVRIVFTKSWPEFLVYAPFYGRPYALSFPFINTLIFAPYDQEQNTVTSGEGFTRNIQDVLTHELVHQALSQNLEFLTYRKMKPWAEEGLAEYIAGGGSIAYADGLKIFCDGKEDKTHAYRYFRYKIAVGFVLNQEGASLMQLVEATEPLESVLDRARSHYCG